MGNNAEKHEFELDGSHGTTHHVSVLLKWLPDMHGHLVRLQLSAELRDGDITVNSRYEISGETMADSNKYVAVSQLHNVANFAKFAADDLNNRYCEHKYRGRT